MAAADVRLSGYGRFGLDYNDANAGTATGKTTLTSRLRLQFDMSAETDGGVAFGARFRAQSESRDNTAGAAAWNGARFFVSANGFTLQVGNTVGAFDGATGLYNVANTPTADIGIDGAGFASLVGNVGNNAFDWDAYSSAGAGLNGVEIIYSGGNWGVHVSYSDTSTNVPLPGGRGEENVAISAFYTFGDWTISAAYNDEKNGTPAVAGPAFAGGENTNNDTTMLAVSGDLGFMDLTVAWARQANLSTPNVANNAVVTQDVTKVGIYGGFDIGAATNVIVYVTDEDNPGSRTDGTGYGFNLAHDLGGGVTLTAGARETSGQNSNTTFQAGAYFRF